MKNVSELTDFYYKILFKTLQKLEEDRKHLRDRILVLGVIYTTICAFILSFITTINQDVTNIFFFVFAYFALGSFIYQWLIKNYISEFKLKIIKPLIHALDENLTYSPNKHLPEKYFTDSKLFTNRPDRVSGNDYVKGKIDNINIEFSDFHAEKKHKDSKGRTSWRTIFQGLFIVSEFNKHFKGTTIILPDTAQSSFGDLIGNWLQSNNLSRDELVKMDSVEFEKEFVVYSSDQIEARYILTPSLMQKLLNYQKKSKHPIYISFSYSNIHIAIDYDKDLFEPSVFHSLLKYKIAMEYIGTLHLAIGIVEELKLNEKLWSKL